MNDGHAHRHSKPSHHVGTCDAACRRSHRAHPHLYRFGQAGVRSAEFTARYGKKAGHYVYGATVGKMKRKRERERRRKVR
jgi:hypothetical protein